MKVPLLKAFGMIFRITVKKKGISTLELSREFAIDKKTAWLFKRKMQEVMTGFQNVQLIGTVDSDHIVFGGSELEWRSKFQGEECIALLFVEKRNGNKLGNASGYIVTDQTPPGTVQANLSLIPADKKKAMTSSTTKNDGKNERESLPKLTSRGGAQILIFNLKNWLRGIHHHCSARFANGYLQEFIFRFNKRNNIKMILHETIAAGIFHKPYFYKPFKPSLGIRVAEIETLLPNSQLS